MLVLLTQAFRWDILVAKANKATRETLVSQAVREPREFRVILVALDIHLERFVSEMRMAPQKAPILSLIKAKMS